MGVTCHTCIGGTNIREDMKQLTAGVQVVVGTPGRVYDMFNRSVLRMLFILGTCIEWLFVKVVKASGCL